MKAPWKFLTELTSRRSAKAQQSAIGNDPDPKAPESELVHTPALPPNSPVSASPPAHDEDLPADQGPVASAPAKGDEDFAPELNPPIDTDEDQAPARHEADNSGAEARSLVPQRKPRVKHRERGKRAKSHVAVQSAAAAKDHRSVQPPSSRDSFFHEVTIIDEEIQMLRTQLAQKLHLQNIQLKKMLERFGVS
ncbi:hypothetical protein [Sinorhizobium americanum]|uniref:hypothetical protein n=1 Tax=Sinorhizobium americanum TaxID=194963 RepID=UPI0007D8D3BB|nr:hypothetical protein [Sinorhizobium americanum]OAP39206.1 hypothetical protein ATC00_07055 [Sinorhizobium americanum]